MRGRQSCINIEIKFYQIRLLIYFSDTDFVVRTRGPKTGPFLRSLFGTVFAVGLKQCARSLSVDVINSMSTTPIGKIY